jgi:multiple sugar transport system substrate-binding protein
MKKLLAGVSAGVMSLVMLGGVASAQELPGKFDGVTIDAKLIGGQQYEALYARIAEWEKATGAKVNVL